MSSEKSNDGQIIRLKKDSVVFVEGEPSDYLYIIKKGKVRVVKEQDGRLLPLAVIESEGFLGEMAMFDNKPRSATAIAVEDSELFKIAKLDIKKVLDILPTQVPDLMNFLAMRLRVTNEIVREQQIRDGSDDQGLSEPEECHLKKIISQFRGRL